ncbi:BadF/BadG/BcrA/BcrD ATPase family protein [Roseibacterium sp. SDUM158017]|uniref:BadF/BadG/BcrA/BcrD ATPase family protein n=1 Tax=Roseicyclus salinarum TaxID=3036773 RepID=UPI00241565CC|nr:BadF/BadG/BcrA/BcrD ATPase family protein [Roseibacterium sp. SDUM158017]MDG4647611.1 BadF/BadG/BcrA/BcrD ATPase family protein [Roseibacterium sp. SDUM158017]
MAGRIDIGIDGGGTGCRVAVSVDGGPTHETTGGPANIVTDPASAEASIRHALTEALTAHRLGLDDMRRARVCAGLAGGRLPGVADAFATRLPFLAWVVDDSVTALAGALQGTDGTLASLGTGSFFIRKSGADMRHIGGWGFHLGDEGSAAWLGRRALSLSLRVADGRLPRDPLAEALIAAAPPHPVLFARDAAPGDFAQLARLVLTHAGTPLGKRLVAEALASLEEGLGDVGHVAGTPLVITGGLGDMLAPHLPAPLRRDLRAAAGRPLDGALHLARGLP